MKNPYKAKGKYKKNGKVFVMMALHRRHMHRSSGNEWATATRNIMDEISASEHWLNKAKD